MRKIIIVILLISSFVYNLNAQYRKFDNPIWTIGTAKTISKKQLNLNLLYPSQYGLTKNIEIQTKPLWYIKYPNLGVKITWWNKPSTPNKKLLKRLGIIIGTKHAVYYPTPIMNYIQKKSLLDLDFGYNKIEPIIIMRNELLISNLLRKNKECYNTKSILTLKIGNQKAFKDSTTDYTISTKSNLYRNTAMMGKYSLWYMGLDFDSKISYGLNYCLDIDLYSVGLLENWIIEHKGLAYWYMGAEKRIRMTIGYQLSFTNHVGTASSISPLFDLTYIIYFRKSKNDKDLFEKGVLDLYDDRDSF